MKEMAGKPSLLYHSDRTITVKDVYNYLPLPGFWNDISENKNVIRIRKFILLEAYYICYQMGRKKATASELRLTAGGGTGRKPSI